MWYKIPNIQLTELAERITKGITSFTNKYEALLNKIRDQQRDVDHWVDLADVETNASVDRDLQILSSKQRDRQKLLQDTLHNLRGPIYRIEKQGSEIYSTLSQLHDGMHQIEDGLQENERQEILKWLSSQPYIAHHEEVYRKVIKDTGLWLLQHPQFLEWQRSSASAILWLRGIPGSGKSCLSYVRMWIPLMLKY